MRKQPISEPLIWHFYYELDDSRRFLTDNRILIDDRYVMAHPLPPEGRKGHYRKVNKYLSAPLQSPVPYRDFEISESGSYKDANGLVLNQVYVDFLRQRIPEELLGFGRTGNNRDSVWIVRGDEQVGLLMPLKSIPEFGPDLLAKAESGDAEAQFQVGRHYEFGTGDPFSKHSEVVRWYRRAARQNHPEAMMYMGLHYYFGICCERDETKCLVMLERAIEYGSRDAISWRTKLLQDLSREQYSRMAADARKRLNWRPV